jgi:FkbM family methyltransferase
MARAVQWHIRRAGDSDIEAVITTDHRTRLIVRRENLSAVWMLYSGLHEYHELQFCLRYLRAGDRFVDVGANVGVFTTVIGTRVPGVDLTAIEPFPPALQMLDRNCALNDVLPDIHRVGVGAVSGRATLEVASRDVHNRLSNVPEGRGGGLSVPVMTLDGIVGEGPVRLVKVDVEGGEHDVFRGAARLLSRPDPPVLLFELAGHEANYRTTASDIVELLADHGYRLYLLDGALTPYDGNGPPGTANVVATTNPEAMRARLTSGGGAACTPPVSVSVEYLASREAPISDAP